MVDDVLQALAALLGIERHPDQTGLGEPEDHRQRFHAVAHHHRNMLTCLQATGAQPCRQSRRLGVQHGEGEGGAIEASEDSFRVLLGMQTQ
jgi:hypothetical protein